ncbi:MAG: hypothetical protein MUE68_09815 [Bacteroidetes bacterium]|jgi:hypothetical protein|nr:hypothetical protein [Bacteroidota bacterium]
MSRRSLAILLLCCLSFTVAFAQLTFNVNALTAANAQTDSTETDLSTIPNRAILKTGQNTNIALSRLVSVKYGNVDPARVSPSFSNPQRLTDGIVSFSSIFELVPGQEQTRLMIDLGAFRLVNRIDIFTPSKDFRLRGYSLWLGQDSISFRRAKSVPINDTTVTNDTFNPDTARFVVIQVDRMDGPPSNLSTVITEIRIFSVGFLSGGRYTSKVVDMGRTVNWGSIRWWGGFPPETFTTFQVRTGGASTVNDTWSPWSQEIADTGALFEVFEPRRYMQYRAILYTSTLETPRLDSFRMWYDTSLVATAARARVTPQTVEILKEAIVNYEVTLTLDARSLGIDTLVLQTAVPIVVTGVLLDNAPVGYSARSTPGRIAIGLSPRVSSGSRLVAQIKLTPVLLTNRLPAQIISSLRPDNPQRVDVQMAGGEEGWTLLTTGVPDQIISTAEIDPNPFTPNGDGRNDQTHVSFIVTNLVVPRPVHVEVFDISGRLVRTLLNQSSSARAYVEQDAIIWDGRDDNGRLLPPGLYLLQIRVETDGLNPSVLTRTVTIAY